MKKWVKFILPVILGIVLLAGIAYKLSTNDGVFTNALGSTGTFPASLSVWVTGDTIPATWGNAIEAKIGADNSTVTSSLDYRVRYPVTFDFDSNGNFSTTTLALLQGGFISSASSSASILDVTALTVGSCTGCGATFSFPWTPTTDGNATTTILELRAGGIFATSSFSGLTFFSGLSTFDFGINVNSVDVTNFEGTGLSITTGTLNAEVQSSDLHNAVTLSGTPDYITIDGNQVITRGLIVLTTDVTGLLPASEVSIALGGGTPTIDQVQEYLDNTGSSGFFAGGDLSDGGSGTLNVAAGSGFIRTTNDTNAELQSFKWSASSGIAVTDNTTQYVYVDDSGTISLSTDEFLETPDKILIGVVTDEAGAIESVFSLGVRLDESIGQAGRFIRRVDGISRDVRKGGLIFGQSGDANRDVTMTTGVLWWGRTEYTITAFDTSGADTFDVYILNAKQFTATSSWDNLNFDSSGTLTELGNNKWANLFFYLEPDDHIVMVYGRAQFSSQAGAEMEGVPSSGLPTRISETGVLTARFTFQKSANTATIVSAFDVVFTGAGVTDHGDLAGLTDDDHVRYVDIDGTRALTGNWDVGAFTITGTQFISDIAGGTAPFVVTSNTEVANLKAATVGTIAGLAPDTATTQATQGAITSLGTLTGLTINTSGTLVIPFSATCDSNADGELCQDTTDDQLLLDGRVIQTKVKIWGVTVASTSPIFINAELLDVPTQLDGYTITEIRCRVSGGTSKVIAIEDASANSSEDITCLASVTSDDGSITNATYTAAEISKIDFGATNGAVDTVTISVFGLWTVE